MSTGERIAERRHTAGLSQAGLARLVGVTQGTIGKLEAGITSGSSHLHKIARRLFTTVEYLTGETDDPDEGAPLPPPKPSVQIATMQVLLPDERQLERMFLSVLKASEGLSHEALAHELALLLPKGLALLRGSIVFQDSVLADSPPAGIESDHPVRRRG